MYTKMVCLEDMCTVHKCPWKIGGFPGRLMDRMNSIQRPIGLLNVESDFP